MKVKNERNGKKRKKRSKICYFVVVAHFFFLFKFHYMYVNAQIFCRFMHIKIAQQHFVEHIIRGTPHKAIKMYHMKILCILF